MPLTAAETARAWRERESGDQSDLIVGVAGSFTAEPIEASLGLALIEQGWANPRMRFADFNQMHQLCLDPIGVLGGEVDHILAMWRIEDVFSSGLEAFLEGDDKAMTPIVDGSAELAAMFVQLAEGANGVTVSTPPFPQPWGVDLLDERLSSRLAVLHRAVAAVWLTGLSASTRVSLLDLDTLVRLEGASSAIDETKWALYHQPYVSRFWGSIGRAAAGVIARQHRPAPKCIVLDCDNTLWGGIVGEDGLAGLGLGDVFPGSAFRTFQFRLRQLRSAGVMLAVASKNDKAAVDEVFRNHDGMALTADDIVSWRVNWAPKSANIKEIADELNIGLDSLVFVDDSPYELAEVAAALPEVTLLQVPEESADLPGLIGRSGLFRNLRVSDEDRQRTEMMVAESARRGDQHAMSGEDFLHSLDLRVKYFAPRAEHISRVAQLTNKTNQFNLTTIRRTEAEISALLDSSEQEVRTIRVMDRFGDYGLVGVAVLTITAATWTVESFLMSCRVLGRGVESAFLASIAADASHAGASELCGRFVPTPKNGQVADFYLSHGFDVDGDAGTEYRMLLADALQAPEHITVTR